MHVTDVYGVRDIAFSIMSYIDGSLDDVRPVLMQGKRMDAQPPMEMLEPSARDIADVRPLFFFIFKIVCLPLIRS